MQVEPMSTVSRTNGETIMQEPPELQAGDTEVPRPFPERRRALESVLEAMGGTPLIRLRKVAPPSGARLFAKVEYFNPGVSVNDRIAIRMVEAAERVGRLQPGSTVLQPTSGDTVVALANVASVEGT